MESYTFSAPTKNQNKYLLSKQCICYVHPELSENSGDEYYRKKYKYFANHGFFEDDDCDHNSRLNPVYIKSKVINVLVFGYTA
jgi:hypothetical protein